MVTKNFSRLNFLKSTARMVGPGGLEPPTNGL